MNSSFLDVTFTAEELRAVDVADTTVVVVDVLRATTTITAALGAGALGLWAVTTPEAARGLGQSMAAITAGERGGRQIPGLDLGNSPMEHASPTVAGRRIALTTSNGTRVIALAADAPTILLGCFNNIGALTRILRETEHPRILVACAGTAEGTRVTPEDILFAGDLVSRLERGDGILGGGATVARDYAAQRCGDVAAVLRESPAGRNLVDLGFEEDLDWASHLDSTDVVPRVVSGTEPGSLPFIVATRGG